MNTDNLTNRPLTLTVATPTDHDGSYVDWAALLVGAVFALVISFLLVSFGAALQAMPPRLKWKRATVSMG